MKEEKKHKQKGDADSDNKVKTKQKPGTLQAENELDKCEEDDDAWERKRSQNQ